MGINGPEEKRIEFAGVNFNPEQVAEYGKSEDLYYINFKDGTKVKFAQQRRGASIYGERTGNFNDYSFRNFDSVFVKGSDKNDYYNFSACKGGSISTDGDKNGDIIRIDEDCSNMRISKDEWDDIYNDGQGTIY